MGRWGSSAVLGYVRDAAASPEAALARRPRLGRTLEDTLGSRSRGLVAAEVLETVAGEVRRQAADFLAKVRADLFEELRALLAPRAAPAPRSPPSPAASG